MCVLFGIVTAHAAPAADPVIVGLMIVPVTQDKDVDAVIKQLRQEGLTTIRTGLSYKRPQEDISNFVSKAFKNGIGTILIVPPDAGAPAYTSDRRYRRTTGPWPQ
jgi:hypothetical protein